jgi:methylated-DNA-[protein]-cysteine S-methyltransferase
MEKIYYGSMRTSMLGEVFVASTEKGLCMVDFMTSEKGFLQKLEGRFRGEVIRNDRRNRNVLTQIDRYLKGKIRKFDTPLDLRGTPFQKRVWDALLKIPYGHTRTYQDVARAIGHPRAFRAVGNANGSNCIPLIIPCHRVIASDGGLGGYGHGLEVKRRLLDLERAHSNRSS